MITLLLIASGVAAFEFAAVKYGTDSRVTASTTTTGGRMRRSARTL